MFWKKKPKKKGEPGTTHRAEAEIQPVHDSPENALKLKSDDPDGAILVTLEGRLKYGDFDEGIG